MRVCHTLQNVLFEDQHCIHPQHKLDLLKVRNLKELNFIKGRNFERLNFLNVRNLERHDFLQTAKQLTLYVP